MSHKSRLNKVAQEAITIAKLAKIMSKNARNQVSKVRVPGSEGTQNDVIIRHLDNGVITVECMKVTGVGYVPCEGYKVGYICYHALTAIIKAVTANSNYKPYFRVSRDAAQKAASYIADDKIFKVRGKPFIFKIRRHVKQDVVYNDRHEVYMYLVKET